jgi:hypothetical protein
MARPNVLKKYQALWLRQFPALGTPDWNKPETVAAKRQIFELFGLWLDSQSDSLAKAFGLAVRLYAQLPIASLDELAEDCFYPHADLSPPLAHDGGSSFFTPDPTADDATLGSKPSTVPAIHFSRVSGSIRCLSDGFIAWKVNPQQQKVGSCHELLHRDMDVLYLICLSRDAFLSWYICVM